MTVIINGNEWHHFLHPRAGEPLAKAWNSHCEELYPPGGILHAENQYLSASKKIKLSYVAGEYGLTLTPVPVIHQ